MKKTTSAIILGGVLIAVILGVYLGISEFAVTSPSDGDYILKPTFGVFRCEEAQSSVTVPDVGEYYQFGGPIDISCNDVGSLIDGCTVVFKLPSEEEADRTYSCLSWEVCEVGQPCIEEGEQITNRVCAKHPFQTNKYDRVLPGITLTKNQYILAQYSESGILTKWSEDIAYKGRYQMNLRPYFVYRYDMFSLTNGRAVPNTEDCTTPKNSVAEFNYIVDGVAGGGDLTDLFEDSPVDAHDNLLGLNSLREAGNVVSYMSVPVATIPQYNLFDEGDEFEYYCNDYGIYRVEEITLENGNTYLYVDERSNARVREVRCCNDGDAIFKEGDGHYCTSDFTIAERASSVGEECDNFLNQCPLSSYTPVAGGFFAIQECSDPDGDGVRTCQEVEYIDVECTSNSDCAGADSYCDLDVINPKNSECKSVKPVETCGNGFCEVSRGEDENTCPQDCGGETDGIPDWLVYSLLGAGVLAVLGALAARRNQGGGPVQL